MTVVLTSETLEGRSATIIRVQGSGVCFWFFLIHCGTISLKHFLSKDQLFEPSWERYPFKKPLFLFFFFFFVSFHFLFFSFSTFLLFLRFFSFSFFPFVFASVSFL